LRASPRAHSGRPGCSARGGLRPPWTPWHIYIPPRTPGVGKRRKLGGRPSQRFPHSGLRSFPLVRIRAQSTIAGPNLSCDLRSLESPCPAGDLGVAEVPHQARTEDLRLHIEANPTTPSRNPWIPGRSSERPGRFPLLQEKPVNTPDMARLSFFNGRKGQSSAHYTGAHACARSPRFLRPGKPNTMKGDCAQHRLGSLARMRSSKAR